jgi:hypothetical protein
MCQNDYRQVEAKSSKENLNLCQQAVLGAKRFSTYAWLLSLRPGPAAIGPSLPSLA